MGKVDDNKIQTTAYLLLESMNRKELFKMCVLILMILFDNGGMICEEQ